MSGATLAAEPPVVRRRWFPRPDLARGAAALACSFLLLMLARIVPLPAPRVELWGLPLHVIARFTVFTGALFALFGAYLYAIYSVRALADSPALPRLVVAVTAGLSVLAMANGDLFSSDVYLYAMYGRMVSAHGLNPYVTLPAVVANDPLVDYVFWRNVVSSYGPVWTTWSALLDRMTPGGVAAHVLAFRLSGAAFHLVNTLLVGRVVGRFSPRHRAVAMALYGWSPLAVIEFAGNAHNESMMLFWVLLGLLVHSHGRAVLGTALMAAAVATKLPALLFLPFYLVVLLRGGEPSLVKLRRMVTAAAVALGVYTLAWAPYLWGDGWRRMFALPVQSGWYLNSLPAVAYNLVRGGVLGAAEVLGLNPAPVDVGDFADLLVRALSLTLILVAGLRLGALVRQRGDLVEMWFWFLFVYLFFVGPHFWPWYATSLVVLAAISRQRYVFLVTTSLSLSAMWVYSCPDCGSYVVGSPEPLTGLLIFLVPLAALGAILLRDSSRGRAPFLERGARIG